MNDGRAMGSLLGICGRVLRVPDDSCLDAGRDDDVSPPLDLDMLIYYSVNIIITSQVNENLRKQT